MRGYVALGYVIFFGVLGIVSGRGRNRRSFGDTPWQEGTWNQCTESCDGGTRTLSWHLPCNTFTCGETDLPEECGCGEADIMLILDRSVSVGHFHFWRLKQFLQDFVNAYNAGLRTGDVTNVRFAAIIFDAEAEVVFDFDEGLTLADVDSLMEEIWEIPYTPADMGTDTPDALLLADYILQTQGRPTANQKVLIVTNTAADKNLARYDESMDTILSRYRSVFVVGVGVGHRIDASELLNLTGSIPERVYEAENYHNLSVILGDVVEGMCCLANNQECSPPEMSECSKSCGIGETTYTGTCDVSDHEGTHIGQHAYVYTQMCCIEPCQRQSTGPGNNRYRPLCKDLPPFSV